MHFLILIFLNLRILLIDTFKITSEVSINIRLAIDTRRFINLLWKWSIFSSQEIRISLNPTILIELITNYHRSIIDKHPQYLLQFLPHLRTCRCKYQEEIKLYLIKLNHLHRVIPTIIHILTLLSILWSLRIIEVFEE